ncbi:hypothetical protein PhCBS80983_g03881 [Powellomyces hirtus]|uniref:Uncharacterized protein n=1 Tax=Powellomyces hirtus TaxID=109895 RepID=A0A507E206_9FUNG|nr:hypothetical protein PhCBS80983_g03881 [Powellomyces hirtus]
MTQDQDPSSLLTAANAAFLDETYTTARDLYSQLLTSTAPSAEILLKRATCNHNLAAFDSAVTDAEEALKLAGPDKKTSAKAHMRVGMAYLELNRIQDAIDAFVAADGEGLAAGPWIEKCVKLGGKGV